MTTTLIAMTLSDGTSCYGRPTERPGDYWLRRTSGRVSDEYNAAAPVWARQQAEAALVGGGWGMGDVIEVHP